MPPPQKAKKMVNPTHASPAEVLPDNPVMSPMVTVPLEPLCVLLETAQQHGLYPQTPQFEAFLTMPPEVLQRMTERQAAATEHLIKQTKI